MNAIDIRTPLLTALLHNQVTASGYTQEARTVTGSEGEMTLPGHQKAVLELGQLEINGTVFNATIGIYDDHGNGPSLSPYLGCNHNVAMDVANHEEQGLAHGGVGSDSVHLNLDEDGDGVAEFIYDLTTNQMLNSDSHALNSSDAMFAEPLPEAQQIELLDAIAVSTLMVQ